MVEHGVPRMNYTEYLGWLSKEYLVRKERSTCIYEHGVPRMNCTEYLGWVSTKYRIWVSTECLEW